MKKQLKPALLWTLAVCLSGACTGLAAGPAPWYKWRSKIDGYISCSQTPLGPGWEQADGPYKDSRCEKRSLVK